MPLFRFLTDKPGADGFYHLGAAADLGQERMQTVEIDGQPVIITRLDDEFHAFSAACPHAAGDLRKGEIYRGRIDCPEHDYRFDVRSGRTLWPPDEVCRLRKYEIVQRDGQLYIRLANQAGP